MTRTIIYTISIFSLFNTCVVQAGLFGLDNYDECITESMKGVKSDVAAREIMRSCRERFPSQDKSRVLSSTELQKLTGRAALVFVSYYSGKIYNGNRNLTITEVTVVVETTIDGKEVTREYIDEVHIKPLKTGDFDLKIIVGDEGADYSWALVGAKGY